MLSKAIKTIFASCDITDKQQACIILQNITVTTAICHLGMRTTYFSLCKTIFY